MLTPKPALFVDGCPMCQSQCPHYGTDAARKGRCALAPYQIIAAEARVCHPAVATMARELHELRRRAGLLGC
jgi:hypothetical protein